MNSSAAQKAERIVGSFASLMSSALTLTGDSGHEPLKDSSDVLPRLISPGVAPDDVCTVIPSLVLKHGETSSKNSSLEESAALNLARPISLSPKELGAAPMALLANLCDSFTMLIDSRLRSSIAALVQQSHRQKDATLTRVLVGLLACAESPISPCTLVTSFRTLPALELTPNGEIVMPIVMEAVVDLKIFGNLVTVNIVAPGTIQTALAGDLMICKAEIVLDTLACLQSMMKQARFAVRKAVATASKLATNLLMPSSLPTYQPSSDISSFQALTASSAMMPKKVSSSQNLKEALMQNIQNSHQNNHNQNSSSSSTQRSGSSQNSGSQNSGSSSNRSTSEPAFLMPPPPSRPSKLSLVDLTKSSPEQEPEVGGNNASWGAPAPTPRSAARQRAIASGLSLLTAAAGLNGGGSGNSSSHHLQPSQKRQRTDHQQQQVSLPRKVTSCPRLEAAV